MERLTIRNKYGDINPPYQLTSQDEEDDWNSDCRKKLAYYEDLDENGKLKELPCKIGDIVYVVSPLYTFPKKHIHERKICRFLTIESDWYFETEMFTHKLEEFVVNVFLTREEADNKLKEMNNV